ncbi:DUF397 domain-containing protein [Streptomyces sp. NBC_01304]|uniref:DUF397 domain-containing protein n=1 Tax=Streptomyces sp. NBC_01304 TaxID=2903818 RepID=UPI002E0EE77E|nr:DUF397 domain-containing protein [Streptomyces sp. NBC_01304]
MSELTWQKSTYSESGSSCVYLATTPAGTIHLRESDDPEVILTTTPNCLATLIRSIRNRSASHACDVMTA